MKTPDVRHINAIYLSLVCLLVSLPVRAQSVGTCESPTADAFLDVNNVRARIFNTGSLFRYREGVGEYEVPQGSGLQSFYIATLWLGGTVDGTLKMSASRYGASEMWAGPLDDDGLPPTNCDDFDRLYRVHQTDVASYERDGEAAYDLADWPTGLGAPTLDPDGNLIDVSHIPFSIRRYRVIDLSSGERPALKGEQMVWWVMNDRGNEHASTDTPPMGIEVHASAFATESIYDHVNNTTLYNYRIFNRNTLPITDMYIGMFIRADLEDWGDNYSGSDSVRGMAFVYAADNDGGRNIGYGTRPPAVGALLLEGPLADNDQLDNDFDALVDEGGERTPMTSFGTWHNGPGPAESPTRGQHYYNYMRSSWKDGKPFTKGGIGRDYSNVPVKFLFPGDPVTAEYWSELNIDGQGTPRDSGYRSVAFSSGPFTLGSNESTDFTIAFVWARGENNLDSITRLREAADFVRLAFDTGYIANPRKMPVFYPPPLPNESAALGENFPEPFSETSTIRYRLSDRSKVRLVVYDVLGRVVHTLVNRIQNDGIHTATFDGSDLPSGVYFYRIQIGHATATRSMMLVK